MTCGAVSFQGVVFSEWIGESLFASFVCWSFFRWDSWDSSRSLFRFLLKVEGLPLGAVDERVHKAVEYSIINSVHLECIFWVYNFVVPFNCFVSRNLQICYERNCSRSKNLKSGLFFLDISLLVDWDKGKAKTCQTCLTISELTDQFFPKHVCL